LSGTGEKDPGVRSTLQVQIFIKLGYPLGIPLEYQPLIAQYCRWYFKCWAL